MYSFTYIKLNFAAIPKPFTAKRRKGYYSVRVGMPGNLYRNSLFQLDDCNMSRVFSNCKKGAICVREWQKGHSQLNPKPKGHFKPVPLIQTLINVTLRPLCKFPYTEPS